MEIELIRQYYPAGTNGEMKYKGRLLCYTIELPWLNNKPTVSCIPEGRYRIKMRYSLKHKTHMQLEGVSGRDLILIHPANDAVKELKGCIAPVSQLTGMGKGNLSRSAFEALRNMLLKYVDKEPVFITIKSTTNDDKTKVSGTNAALL